MPFRTTDHEIVYEFNEEVTLKDLPNNKKIVIKSAHKVNFSGVIEVKALYLEAPSYKFKDCQLKSDGKTILKGTGDIKDSKLKCVELAMKGDVVSNNSKLICNKFIQKENKLLFYKSNLRVTSRWEQDNTSEFKSKYALIETINIETINQADLTGYNNLYQSKWTGDVLMIEGRLSCEQAEFDLNKFFNHGTCKLISTSLDCKTRIQDNDSAMWKMGKKNYIAAKDIFLQSTSSLRKCLVKTDSLWEFGKRTLENTVVLSNLFFSSSDSSTKANNSKLLTEKAIFRGNMLQRQSVMQSKDLLSYESLSVRKNSTLAAENAHLSGDFDLQQSQAQFNHADLSGEQTLKSAGLKANSITQQRGANLRTKRSFIQAQQATLAGSVSAQDGSVVTAEQLATSQSAKVSFWESDLLVSKTLLHQGKINSENNDDKKRHTVVAQTLLSEGGLASNNIDVQANEFLLTDAAQTALKKTQLVTGSAVISGQTEFDGVLHQSNSIVVTDTTILRNSTLFAKSDIQFTQQASIFGSNLTVCAPIMFNSGKVKLDHLKIESDWFVNNGEIETKKLFDVRANQGAINAFGSIRSPAISITAAGISANLAGDICGFDSITKKSLIGFNFLSSDRSWNYSSANVIEINVSAITPFTTPSSFDSVLTFDRCLGIVKNGLTAAIPKYATGINFVYNTGIFCRAQGNRAWSSYLHYQNSNSTFSDYFTKNVMNASPADFVGFAIDTLRMAISYTNFAKQFDTNNLTKISNTPFDLKTAAKQFFSSGAQLFMPSASTDAIFSLNGGFILQGNVTDNLIGTANFGAKLAGLSYTNLSRYQFNKGILAGFLSPTILQGERYAGNGAVIGYSGLNMQFNKIDRVMDLIQGTGDYQYVLTPNGFSLAVNQDLLIDTQLKRHCDLNLQGTQVHVTADQITDKNVVLKSTVTDVQVNGVFKAKSAVLIAKTNVVNRGDIKAEKLHVEAEEAFYNQAGHIEADKVTGHAALVVNATLEECTHGELTQQDKDLDAATRQLQGETVRSGVVASKDSGVIKGKEVTLIATKEDAVNRAGTIAGSVQTKVLAKRDVISRPHREGNTYVEGKIRGGTGEGHDGVGLVVLAGHDVLAAAQCFSSIGDNIIQAACKIQFGAFVETNFSDKQTRNTRLTETTHTVYGNQVVSEKGRNIIIALEGGMEFSATLFKAAKGTEFYSKKDVDYLTLKYKDSMEYTEGHFFGARHVSATQDRVAGCILDDNGKSIIVSFEGRVRGKDVALLGKGDLDVIAKSTILFENSILKSDIRERSSGFSFAVGRFSFGSGNNTALVFLKVDPTVGQAYALRSAGDKVTAATEALALGKKIQGDKATLANAKSLSGAALQRYGLGDEEKVRPRIGLQITRKKTQRHTEQSSGAGMERGKVRLQAENSVALNGYNAKTTGDMWVKTNEFTMNGREYRHSQSESSTTFGITLQAGSTPGLSASHSTSQSNSRVVENQQLSVGGTLHLEVKKMQLNGANARANKVTGHVGIVEVNSLQDKVRSKSRHVSADTSGNVAAGFTNQDSLTTNSVSGLHSEQGFDDFSADETHLKGARISSDKPSSYKSRIFTAESLHDTQHATGASFSTNVTSLVDTVSKIGSDNAASTPVRVSVQYEDAKTEHQSSVIGCKVEAETTTGHYATSVDNEKINKYHHSISGTVDVDVTNTPKVHEKLPEVTMPVAPEVSYEASAVESPVESPAVENKWERIAELSAVELPEDNILQIAETEAPKLVPIYDVKDDYTAKGYGNALENIVSASLASRAFDSLRSQDIIVSHTTSSFEYAKDIVKSGAKTISSPDNYFGGEVFYVAEGAYSIHEAPGPAIIGFYLDKNAKIFDATSGYHPNKFFDDMLKNQEYAALAQELKLQKYDAIKYEGGYLLTDLEKVDRHNTKFTYSSNYAVINPKVLKPFAIYPEPISEVVEGFSQTTVRSLQKLGKAATAIAVVDATRKVYESKHPWWEAAHQTALFAISSAAGNLASTPLIAPCVQVGALNPPLAPVSVPACIAVGSVVASVAATTVAEVAVDHLERAYWSRYGGR